MFENSKLSRYKIRKLIECFCIDIDATKTTLLLKLNRKTVNRYFLAFRRLICAHQLSLKEQSGLAGDQSLDGHAAIQGRLKHSVFGIYERDGCIYTELVSAPSAKSLRALIKGKVPLEHIVQSEGWRGYDGLVDVGHDKYVRTGKTEKSAKIDDIEAFWSFAKRRLAKFNGTNRNFDLHLKECEWRYNRTLPQLLISINRLIAQNADLMV